MTFSEMCTHPSLTITVRSLRAQHEGAEILVGILLESGEHREQKNLVLTVEQYTELRPEKGIISEELYERLEEACELCRAVRVGENLLSYGSNSAKMLAQKIARHGYRREIAQAAAQKLCERGLVDEERDMRREVEKCIGKLWGSKRISAHLWTRGFDQDVMQLLPSMLEEIDFVENCVALIRKHYGDLPTDTADQKKMIASLGRYGYSLGEIREAMRTLERT